MKLLILFTIVASLQVSANGYGQTVTLSVKNIPLEKVFKEVKKQTGFSFVYTRDQLKNSLPVTIHIVRAQLKEVLSICFSNQPLSFTIEGNYVVVQTKHTTLPTILQPDSLIDIKGHVINENGDPIPGATVIAKHSNRGVSTNSRGDFVLQGVNDEDILSISSVGFYGEEIAINKQRFFVISLRFAVNSLEETVVKGYYSTSRKLNTGNVVKINGSQITNQPVSNPILGLEGLVPGLLITQNNGLPGSRFKALIRGQNSIQNGNSPLFIIDGVPFLSDNDALTQLNGMLANSPFNSLDPNDIESIEILKDADATAIYGSRGANGVILVTTKKNKADRNSLSLNISHGWGKVARTMQMMNTQQYLEMRKEAFLNDGITPTNNSAPDLVSWDQNRYTDWKKEFIGGTAQTYNAQLRYSGGNQFTKFSFGTGYYKETTAFPGDFGDKKTTVDININHKSTNNKLNLNFIASYGYDKNLLPARDLTGFITLPPNSYPLKDASGNYIWREAGYSVGNPLASLLQRTEVSTDRSTANGIITYKPLNGLEIKVNFGYNKVGVNEKIQSPIASQDPAFAPKGTSVLGDNFIKTWIIEPQVSYMFNLNNKFKMEMLAGTTWQKTEAERKLITGSGYTNDELLGSIAAAPVQTATNSNAQYNYAAIFGRIGINWDNKYIFNITGRRDGSSRFGPDKRFANFGAAGVGWIFSNVSSIRKAIPFLSFGKLRGSYGLTGNDQIGNYQYLDTYRGTIFAYDGQPGLTPSRLFNSDYSWEENKKIELAAELGFFQDKLTVNLTYYKNKSDNQIIRYSLPTQTGFTDVLLNFPGVVQNKGYEISLNAEIIKTKNFQWNTSFNISHNENKLISFPGLANSSYASTYVIGKPLNAFSGLHFMGVNPQTGIYQFEDLNKDGIISNADNTYAGTTDPKYFGGFSNFFHYKNFQLSILLEFRKQVGVDPVYSSGSRLGYITNQPTYTLNRWRNAGDIVPYQRYTQSFTNSAFSAASNVSSSDARLTDASYLRLKNIAFSYDFPSSWIKKLNALSWRIFFQTQNLFTITKYKGHDPENQSLGSLPPLRMISVGTQINF
ncbi:MAG: SusC/RagA family TonB-linked outer membrane protein [Ferruginibacter sp.]|nr:SusC/RagA family TonB-linked outer membrane protein [Ferruginibacter sp.]